MIEQAYLLGELLGLPTWTLDEAGPYQAIPHPGASWQPEGHPALQPHEYVRGGTVKLLTLFHPATGSARVQVVDSAPNTVLHPWLQGELTRLLEAEGAEGASVDGHWRMWETWGYAAERLAQYTATPAPQVRLLLVLDNLAGHRSKLLVAWCLERGVALLYTPLGGSCYNLAESFQRILVRRVLDGQHYQTAERLKVAFVAGVEGWNAAPTPFEWGGKRWERRQRAKARRYRQGGAEAYTDQPLTPRGHCQQANDKVCQIQDK